VTNVPEWSAYYDAVRDRPPHETLLAALGSFAEPGLAVDLGCGDGRDTVELLRRGWSVVAIDAEAEAIERLRARVGESGALETQVARFEDVRWPRAELLNAGFSLPFCHPDRFDDLWRCIRASIGPGGRFCGQLFGERDGWAGEKDMTFHSREAADALFVDFEHERFDEEETDGETAVGEPKHWHVFHVVAVRIREPDADLPLDRAPP
jgi:tellurite methyltransferase